METFGGLLLIVIFLVFIFVSIRLFTEASLKKAHLRIESAAKVELAQIELRKQEVAAQREAKHAQS